MIWHRLIAPKPSGITRDHVVLVLADGRELEVLRVRNPRARRIRLSVDERGARLTLPTRASLASGERFLHDHRDWLATQLDRFAHPAELPVLVRDRTTRLPLRGRELPLHWHVARYSHVELADDGIHLHLSARASDAVMRKTLRAFYEAQARADIGRWLPRYLPGLPRAPRQIRLKIMSSQWGSLAPDGSLALDLSLVLAEPAAFEYVLVHELCHLIHANHSPAFWQEVSLRCPHWQGQRDYFNLKGRQLKAAMRSLMSA